MPLLLEAVLDMRKHKLIMIECLEVLSTGHPTSVPLETNSLVK